MKPHYSSMNILLFSMAHLYYPLVICYIAIEHGQRNSGFTQLQNGDSPVCYVNVYQMAIDSISMYIPLFFTEGILIFYW
jgi:hypothetical protein